MAQGDDTEDDEADEGEDSAPAEKAVPEKRRKKLPLDAATWQRDEALLDLALLAQKELGDVVFDDHNVFREKFDAAMKAHGQKPAQRKRRPSSRP